VLAAPAFDIPSPQLYRCQVYRYFSGLSRLYVSAFKPYQTTPAFFLLFSDVAYFEGPMGWESADFRHAPHDECVALLLEAGIIGEAVRQFPDAYAAITEAANLYVVRAPHTCVRVIAGSAALLPEIPASL
jgi:hypothetical protein